MNTLGKLIRLPLRLIPPETVVRVVLGPSRGAKWIAGSGLHGFWLGTFEARKRRLFAKTVKPGNVVYDIGAHVGYYTILSSRLVKHGSVYAFEPLSRNLEYLRLHVGMNELKNVNIVDAAVSDQTGVSSFEEGFHTNGHLSEHGGISVRTLRLDTCEFPPPDIIKMDIEGGEADALHGMADMLRLHHPIIFLATHSTALNVSCFSLLKDIGYDITPIDGSVIETTREVIAQFTRRQSVPVFMN